MDIYFYISKIFTPLIVPSNFLIFSLIIFFYLGIYKKKIFFKKLFILSFLFFSTISIIPVGNNLIFFFLEKEFYVSKVDPNIDFIFVPSGGKDRIITAIKIKNEYNLDDIKILYSPGDASLNKKKSIDGENNFTKSLVLNSKIEEKDIVYLPEARNTFENFEQLNKYLIRIKKKNSKILLITHAYHIKRSLIISKKFNLDIHPYPSFFFSKRDSMGFINSYQNISVVRNLSNFDAFIKELISSMFTSFL